MKLLIIAKHIGGTAPGIVFERIVSALSEFHTIDLYVCFDKKSEECDFSRINRIVPVPYPTIINKRINAHINNCSYALCGISLNDWIKRHSIKPDNFDYDLVLALCSVGSLYPLVAGYELTKAYPVKLACYFVDAIPTPKWWSDDMTNNGVGRFIRKYLSKVDYLASSNENMLAYQLSFLGKVEKHPMSYGVWYTPNLGEKLKLNKRPSDKYIFLYTGGIYGRRKISYLLEAFEMLLIDYPDAYLYFVGAGKNILKSVPSGLPHIEAYDYTTDLNSFYSMATALIDIDADVDNDVFLSSKITNYILAERPIIGITGENSPSRNIFTGTGSIIHCHHDKHEIYQAMRKTIEDEFDFKDRNQVLNDFSIANIAAKVNQELEKLLKKRHNEDF